MSMKIRTTRRRGRAVRAALLLTGLAAAPAAPLRAQQVAPAPLEILLESREALGLTAEQVEGLRRLRARLSERNEPLVTRMLELRTRWQGEQRAAGRAAGGVELGRSASLQGIREAAQPINQQIQANNRAAMQEVNRLLTGEQRQRLRAIVQARRPPGRGASAARGGGAGLGR
jgi:hypothetical protein